MQHSRPAAIAAPALFAMLLLTGCTQQAPTDSAPPSPTQIEAPPRTEPPATEAPATEPPETESPVPDDWSAYVLGDGHTSWSLPPGWTADIETEVVEGNPAWTDHRGLIRDADGTPMLQFKAIASGGQYASDGVPCERPETEVYEILPLGEQVAGGAANAVTLAYDRGDGRIALGAGVSTNDAEGACEPGILALYPEEYDFVYLQIVADDGLNDPTFASFEEARAYLGTEEYAAVRGVLASFEFH